MSDGGGAVKASVGFFAGHGDGDAPAPRMGLGVPSFAFGQRGLEVVPPPAFSRSHGGHGGRFAHQNDAPPAAPAFELQFAFQALPSVSGVFPVALAQAELDEPFDVEGVFEFEQAGHAACFALEENAFGTIGATDRREIDCRQAARRAKAQPSQSPRIRVGQWERGMASRIRQSPGIPNLAECCLPGSTPTPGQSRRLATK